jgi:CRP/FNR family cyclic AMP-dependent transcriptional regulator
MAVKSVMAVPSGGRRSAIGMRAAYSVASRRFRRFHRLLCDPFTDPRARGPGSRRLAYNRRPMASPALSDEQLIDALPSAALRDLARRGRVQHYRKDSVIVHEGDHGDTLFIILAGRVKVFASSSDDREIVFNIHGAGEYVGEMALDGGPRSASIITLEPTTCVVVTRVTLKEHMGAHPDFAFDLLTKVISRARRATENARSLALDDVYRRVKRLFESLAVDVDGQRVVPERLTHQEIADRVGASREMISRLMKDLVTGGYLDVAQKLITLKKPLPPAW